MGKGQIGVLLYGTSNAFAAFAIAGVVTKGTALIDVPLIAGGSLQAYFLGLFLSFGILAALKSMPWLATAAAALCLLLTSIELPPPPIAPLTGIQGVKLFALLSFGFAGAFSGRSFRINEVAPIHMIPWIEAPYHITMVLTAIFMARLKTVPFALLLQVDCALLLIAALIDVLAYRYLRSEICGAETPESQKMVARKPFVVAAALIVLTVAIQGGAFIFVHQSTELATSTTGIFPTDYLAASYLGAALGALGVGIAKPVTFRGNRQITFLQIKHHLVPIYSVVVLSSVALILSMAASARSVAYLVPLGLCVVSIVAFQFVVYPLLHTLGETTKKRPIVHYCFCFMALGVFISLAALQFTTSMPALVAFIITATACALFLLRVT